MCTCELAKETQAPLLTRNKAIVIVAAVAAAATAAGIAVFGRLAAPAAGEDWARETDAAVEARLAAARNCLRSMKPTGK